MAEVEAAIKRDPIGNRTKTTRVRSCALSHPAKRHTLLLSYQLYLKFPRTRPSNPTRQKEWTAQLHFKFPQKKGQATHPINQAKKQLLTIKSTQAWQTFCPSLRGLLLESHSNVRPLYQLPPGIVNADCDWTPWSPKMQLPRFTLETTKTLRR